MPTCIETFKECQAARAARVEEVLASAQPWETERELAEKAGVDQKTINRYKVGARLDCNSPPPLLKLKDMYADDVGYWGQRPVMAVEAALEACNKEQLAYLFSEVLPVVELNLRKGNVK